MGVVSPFGGKRHEVSLHPSDVIAIVFWTKNASPLLRYLDELAEREHCFTFLYTINNYPAALEPRVPDLCHTLKIVQSLTTRFSPSILRWRYDTIVLTDTMDRRWHVKNFDCLCEKLSPYVEDCFFSFCDYYRKTARNMGRVVPDYHRPDEAECRELAEELACIARSRGISLASCAHDFLLSPAITKARCIDPVFLTRVVDSDARRSDLAKLKTTPSRKECGCAASRDVGAYDTCIHGCAYCYANTDPIAAARNLELLEHESFYLDPRASTRRVGLSPCTQSPDCE